tara:strand:+ start:1517 stop:2227 length:711 start_codon:yes stop_codon:yes gene_type:complete
MNTGFTNDEIVDVASQYGSFMNQSGNFIDDNENVDLNNEDVVRVATSMGMFFNNTGFIDENANQPSITLDHHDSRLGPNMVLETADTEYSNHPGFLGITWSSKKREEQRYQKELNKVNNSYPNTGSCAVMTDSLNRLDDSIAQLESEEGEGGRGARRVRARALKARNARRGSVAAGQEAACAGEQAEIDRMAMWQTQMMAPPTSGPAGISATNLLLGVVVLGGLVYGITRLARPKS